MTDLRYASRWLLKHPGFSAVVILTMALGIAANTAVFSIVDALFLRPLPVRHADRLALVDSVGSKGGASFSVGDLEAMRRDVHGLEGLAGHGRGGSIFRDSTGAGGAVAADHWIIADYVAGPYFETLGVSAARGRLLTAADQATLDPAPIVLSDAFWRQHFAREERVLDRLVSINGNACIIVGIAPASFFGLMAGTSPDLWAPVSLVGRAYGSAATTAKPTREIRWLHVFGTLVPDASGSLAASRESARISLGQIWRQRDKNLAERTPIVGPLTPWQTWFAQRYRSSLQILIGLVSVLLLIACVNVVTLVMTRAAGRQKEIAIRVALGVGRARLIRQVLAEYLLLASVALLIALPLSGWLATWLVSLGSQPYLPMILNTDPTSSRPLLFSVGLTVSVGLAVGLWPAVRAMRLDPNAALHATAATVGSARLRHLSGAWALLPIQIALGVVLLVAAGLFTQTLSNLRRGMQDVDPRHLIFGSVSMEATGVVGSNAHHGRQMAEQALERVRALPGIDHAAMTWMRPLADYLQGPVSADAGQDAATAESTGKIARFDWVSPHYFDTIGMTLRRGRDFTAADNMTPVDDRSTTGASANLIPNVIVNERLVEQLFGHRDADVVGRTIRWGRPSGLAQIVGVVTDTHLNDLQQPPHPILYLPMAGRDADGFELLVRTQQPVGVVLEQIRRALRDIDPQLPLVRAWTFEQEMANALSKEQMIAAVASVFGTLALLLVSIGVFGALSYAVARRSRELAIRVALGASPMSLRSLVLRESLTVAALGLIAGLPLAWLTARTLQSLLHGVHPLDPATLTSVAALVVSVTMLAAYLPARRAAKTDPIIALRAE